MALMSALLFYRGIKWFIKVELDKSKQNCNDKYKINIKNKIEHAVNIKVVIDNPCYCLIKCIKKKKKSPSIPGDSCRL